MMKTKSTSQFAFLNLRVLVGLFIALAGIVLALIGFGAFPAPPASMAQARPTFIQSVNPLLIPPGFDCAQIRDLGFDIQENLRAGAIMIACGQAQGGSPEGDGESPSFAQEILGPLLGTTDTDLITGSDTDSHVTQSETFAAGNPDNPNEIVIAYNDSRGIFASRSEA